jgi:hypothetical protein
MNDVGGGDALVSGDPGTSLGVRQAESKVDFPVECALFRPENAQTQPNIR